MKAAYLDHNATSPVSEAVAARVGELLRAGLGNPSAAHGAGAQARAVVEAARAGVAALVGAHPSEVVFTSGGSEACATAVGHLWRQARRRGRQRPVLVAGATEHPAVLAALGALAEAGEAQVRLVAVDGDGRLCASALRRELDGADGLCAMAANNETGVMTDLEAVAGLVAASGAAWFCDAVQAVGRVPLRFHEAAAGQIALMALSGHKLGAPVGVGALVVRRGVEVTPLILGGQQQRGRRAGTEPAAMLGGLEVAAREAADALAAGEPARVGGAARRARASAAGGLSGLTSAWGRRSEAAEHQLGLVDAPRRRTGRRRVDGPRPGRARRGRGDRGGLRDRLRPSQPRPVGDGRHSGRGPSHLALLAWPGQQRRARRRRRRRAGRRGRAVNFALDAGGRSR
jgi:cysteine desulfurase